MIFLQDVDVSLVQEIEIGESLSLCDGPCLLADVQPIVIFDFLLLPQTTMLRRISVSSHEINNEPDRYETIA